MSRKASLRNFEKQRSLQEEDSFSRKGRAGAEQGQGESWSEGREGEGGKSNTAAVKPGHMLALLTSGEGK